MLEHRFESNFSLLAPLVGVDELLLLALIRLPVLRSRTTQVTPREALIDNRLVLMLHDSANVILLVASTSATTNGQTVELTRAVIDVATRPAGWQPVGLLNARVQSRIVHVRWLLIHRCTAAQTTLSFSHSYKDGLAVIFDLNWG